MRYEPCGAVVFQAPLLATVIRWTMWTCPIRVGASPTTISVGGGQPVLPAHQPPNVGSLLITVPLIGRYRSNSRLYGWLVTPAVTVMVDGFGPRLRKPARSDPTTV